MRVSERREHVLEAGDVRVAIDPIGGGRVTSLRLSGAEILSGPEVHPSNYGATLWTSPQSDWGWPPPAEYDDLPYSAATHEGGAVTLVGPISRHLEVRLVKRFSIDGRDGAIVVESQIENAGAAPRAFAPWLVSRVPARGLTFYPTGATWGGPLPVERIGGVTWYRHEPDVLTRTGAKSFGDGLRGFVAHAHGDVLFVNRFVDLPPELHAPGHGEVEVYANDLYVEVEVQGPYAVIAPGARSLPWAVRWHLKRLPPEVATAVGSASLLAFASAVGS
ncbi:MAG TPA: hypothetical protein VEK07_05475 [Polyangiaceae bacterium]|nr:hypothetical protein [Polyangiaceae bacterium]